MSNWMKNTRTWLGLGNDPYYDDEYGDPAYDDGVDDGDYYYDDDPVSVADDTVVAPDEAVAVGRSGGAGRSAPRSARGAVRSVTPQRGEDWEEGDGGVRVISGAAQPSAPETESRGVVRPLPSAAKPHVVSPSGFNDVQVVADHFKRDQPVIVNLQGVDRDLSRRLIDFASGLCYGLDGDMERVADQVFLLTPRGAQVSDDDRRRIREGGLMDDAR